ncbi:hypothetical protein [Gordonibacter massiliensis (ex Traore et al. 2017)]|uniref:hypothetical protein n=1 Tax=Gordonibacter massiliensis (ex Traore et al. 2017) TaxID=1841863 RepID=UPI001C8B4BE4|nr:hypothetical protein [Gordonibacter massiliensis (ex Traore et al. 2017)]MBX9033812.1 hypothetical protein [Gordonibacter massiliensis (ex Traore et al. 2017)]
MAKMPGPGKMSSRAGSDTFERIVSIGMVGAMGFVVLEAVLGEPSGLPCKKIEAVMARKSFWGALKNNDLGKRPRVRHFVAADPLKPSWLRKSCRRSPKNYYGAVLRRRRPACSCAAGRFAIMGRYVCIV